MTPNQQAVYDALEQFGPVPDHALVPLVQHVAQVHQSSSGIRSRRAELAAAGAVTEVDEIKMPSGRKASVWAVSG